MGEFRKEEADLGAQWRGEGLGRGHVGREVGFKITVPDSADLRGL